MVIMAASNGAVEKSPSYWNMPHRGQMFLLVLCRLTEPIAYSSVSPYLYYMIKSFGYESPATISALSTLFMASFAFGQVLTSVWWGRFSDIFGRKVALMIGLTGTLCAMLCIGLAKNIYAAIAARLIMGLLNGNVGVLRTMVSELITQKEYQTRAFSIMPITMNIGVIIGPLIGSLANPVENYPVLFGHSELFTEYPYLLPNLIVVPLLLMSVLCVIFFVKETAKGKYVLLKPHSDPGLKVGQKIRDKFMGHDYVALEYGALSDNDTGEEEYDHDDDYQNDNDDQNSDSNDEPPSIRSILTYEVKITVVSWSMIMLHAPAFMQLFPLFLSTPRMTESHNNLLLFNGGLGLPISQIGMIISILGFCGIFLQLLVYPWLASRLGNAGVHKKALVLFPIGYFLIPYLSFLPGSSTKTIALCAAVAAIIIVGRTFAIPPMGVLATNAAPSRNSMGTLHGLCQSCTSGARCLGPFILGNLYSLGVEFNMIGLAWWVMVGVTIVEIIVASRLKEWGS